MSLISICKSVLAETGWPVLTTIASNGDATAQQIFNLANKELGILSRKYNWPAITVEYPFNTVAGQTVYTFPPDYRALVPGGIFNKDQYYQVRGSTGLPYWQLLKYGKLGNLSSTTFRVINVLGIPGIEITPAPTGVQALVAVYMSKEYALNNTGFSIPQYAVDDDVSKVSESIVQLGLTWRFRRAKGLDYSAEYAEYMAAHPADYAQMIDTGEIRVGGRRYSDSGLTDGYVRDYGFGV